MIATLSGTISQKLIDEIVVNVGGVGYGVYVTTEDYSVIEGDNVLLYIHEHIRENAHELYGFTEKTTMQLFEQLLGVNGVGPKMALALLSTGSADAVRSAIAGGDVKYLQKASGVGKRVAERVVVDLKDKVGLVSSDDATAFLSDAANLQDEAVEALISLGYSAQDALLALRNIDKKLPLQERIKHALKVPHR